MGWFGVMAAVMAENRDELRRQLTFQCNPNSPLHAFIGAEREYKRLYDRPFPEWCHKIFRERPWSKERAVTAL